MTLSGLEKLPNAALTGATPNGGESGPKARPMHPEWARSIRDQCAAAGVPFLFKQWGEWAPNCICSKGRACPTTTRPPQGRQGVMFRCGKKGSGRLLDDMRHDGYPEVRDARMASEPTPG